MDNKSPRSLDADLLEVLHGGDIATGGILRPLAQFVRARIPEPEHRIAFVTDVLNAMGQFAFSHAKPDERLAMIATAIEDVTQRNPAYVPIAQACLGGPSARAAYA